jgi:hypothetical protein
VKSVFVRESIATSWLANVGGIHSIKFIVAAVLNMAR